MRPRRAARPTRPSRPIMATRPSAARSPSWAGGSRAPCPRGLSRRRFRPSWRCLCGRCRGCTCRRSTSRAWTSSHPPWRSSRSTPRCRSCGARTSLWPPSGPSAWSRACSSWSAPSVALWSRPGSCSPGLREPRRRRRSACSYSPCGASRSASASSTAAWCPWSTTFGSRAAAPGARGSCLHRPRRSSTSATRRRSWTTPSTGTRPARRARTRPTRCPSCPSTRSSSPCASPSLCP
mmetsp:Transcript_20756/g.69624  ORF Transcript_20756/g.69624 Transcript_20756/m.69624 type:complete len:236 (+) Transcript_20756:969-1676(+)